MNLKTFFNKSGDAFLPNSIVKLLDTYIYQSHSKTFYMNGWSIIHFISGVLSTFLIFSFYRTRNKNIKLNNSQSQSQPNFVKLIILLFIIHSIWEIWQFIIGMNSPIQFDIYNTIHFNYTNITDIIVDTLMYMLGGMIMYYIYHR